MTTRKLVAVASGAPVPRGAYSAAAVADGWCYISGQLPLDPDTRQLVGSTPAEQTRRALGNVDAVLVGAGFTIDELVYVQIFFTDPQHWGPINVVYEGWLAGVPPPARVSVPVPWLSHGALVEVQAVAYRRGGGLENFDRH